MNQKIQTSTIMIVLFFVIATLVSWQLYFKKYSQADTVNIHTFPKEINGWTSEEIVITEHEYKVLETKNAFTRKYMHPDGREVTLFIVYSQNNRKVSHPPEVCYQGSGATFVSNVSREIKIPDQDLKIRANDIVVDFGPIQQVMYYWFKVGDDFTSNYWRQQLLIAYKTLTGQPASSALIRLSTTITSDPEQANQVLDDFSRMITPLLFKFLP